MSKKGGASLSRELGLFQTTVAGVGIILGAGIYALIGVAAGPAGNAVWLSFLITAFIAFFTAMSYAELSSMFKGNAAEYDYVKAAINEKFAVGIGLAMILSTVIAGAAVSLGFGGYFASLVDAPLLLGALLLIILMTAINFVGIKQATWFNAISTFIEFAGLVVIVILGVKFFGSVNYLEMPLGVTGVFQSAALVFFAFIGFESIVKLREETKNPEVTIPRAIILSILITSVVYVLVAISAVSVIGWQALAASSAPLAEVARVALQNSVIGRVLAIIALFSTANTVLLAMVTGSRQVYGMAKQGSLPAFLSRVSEKTKTPYVAVLVFAIATILFTLIGDLELVANLTNIFIFITFAAVNVSLIILRYNAKYDKLRGFKCPVNIGKFPVISLIGLISSLAMLVFVIINLLG
jgi:basic amino acid/polyamine antiporter, APA family